MWNKVENVIVAVLMMILTPIYMLWGVYMAWSAFIRTLRD